MFVHWIPNTLTVFRLASLPFFVWLYSLDAPRAAWPAAILIFVAGLTDIADGYIARRWHVESDFGRLVDPFTDRLVFITVLITLNWLGTLPLWLTLPILLRDAALLGAGAILLGRRGERPRILKAGKLSNFVLAWGILFFIIDIRLVGWIIYGVGAAIYLWAGAMYVRREYGEWRRNRRPISQT
jgi:CDP-diacylglycerol--glycerol-3-phosphate 3-phosphatidyltransferase